MKTNKIFLILVFYIIILTIFSIATQESNYVFTSSDGLKYSTSSNGIIKIENKYTILGYTGFAITGTINYENKLYTTENFYWSWKKSYYIYSAQVDFNHTINASINKTFRVDIFTAYNNNDKFNWTQVWEFDERTSPKIKHIITNNLGSSITNTKFWYIHTLKENTTIKYNNIEKTLNNTNYHLEGNFDNIIGKISFNELTFLYDDLISSGFNITDIYIGNGSIINHPLKKIVAIGITKGNRIFSDGERIILDPFETSFFSPSTTGVPDNDWVSGSFVKVSDNQRAYEVDLYDLLSTSDYSITLPDRAIVTGIAVNVEGFSAIYIRPVYSCP